jgi:subtilisin family serine protease
MFDMRHAGARGALTWVIAALAVAASAIPSFAATSPERGRLGRARDVSMPHSTRDVLVKLQSGASAEDVLGAGADWIFGRWYEVAVPASSGALARARELTSVDGVEIAELDYEATLDPSPAIRLDDAGLDATANDPYFGSQWHFPAIQLTQAWDVATGSGTVAAIVDSGISLGGEDLNCHALVSPFNAITDTTGVALDDHGHGTHVAGTVAQCTNNGVGVAGIAYGAELMPVKVGDAQGFAAVSDVAQGIQWAATHGADVINLSLGSECSQPWPQCSASIEGDAISTAVANGVVVVASSGNAGSGVVGTPANNPDVIAVGAVRYDLERAPYSNGGSALDLVAPGGDLSVDQNHDDYGDGVLQETFTPEEGWGYYFFNGTSMSTPHVTGAVALLRSAVPTASVAEIRAALESTALDLGSPGPDVAFGNGLLQVRSALDALGATGGEPGVTVTGRLGGAYARSARYRLFHADDTVRYRGKLDPITDGATVAFELQRRMHSWREVAAITLRVDGAGSARVAMTARHSTFGDRDARLAVGGRYRVRAFITDPGTGAITSAAWIAFRVTT